MSRFFRALALAVLVAACGGRDYAPPRNLDNACAIVRERPAVLRAALATQRKWDVPVASLMAVIHQESKFVGNARTPHKYILGVIPMGRQSSAYGYSQALDATWDEYRRASGGRRARRDDIADAADFIGWYFDGSSERLGFAINDTRRQYLAYHEGRTGYARGTYRSKRWLLDIASQVASRADMYHAQLVACGKLR